MRSCVIGVHLARKLKLSDPDVAETFYASLLAHVECVAFSHEMATVFGDDAAAPADL